MSLEVRPVESVLHGDLADQQALHDLLDRVEALGLELVDIRQSTEGHDDRPVPSRS
jgi:hypothetical protein